MENAKNEGRKRTNIIYNHGLIGYHFRSHSKGSWQGWGEISGDVMGMLDVRCCAVGGALCEIASFLGSANGMSKYRKSCELSELGVTSFTSAAQRAALCVFTQLEHATAHKGGDHAL